MKNKLYMLIGVPGSGKTTWAKNQDWFRDCAYISTDKYVEEWAENVGKTYSEVFEEYMPVAVARMAGAVNGARDAGKDIIWDQTSTTLASRTRKFRMLPDYYAIAIVFQTPDEQEHQRRLKTRPGKVIPEHVLHDMVWNFEMPTLEEGFHEIWHV
jgi:predicted kinase